MQKDIYERVISFLQGASWAIVIVGALVTFKVSIYFGIAVAIFSTITFIILSLFLFLILDAFSVNKKRLEEAQKQTQLLEQLLSSKEV